MQLRPRLHRCEFTRIPCVSAVISAAHPCGQPGPQLPGGQLSPLRGSHRIQLWQRVIADDLSITFILEDAWSIEGILNYPDTRRLIHFKEPVAALYISFLHQMSHLVSANPQLREQFTGLMLNATKATGTDPDQGRGRSVLRRTGAHPAWPGGDHHTAARRHDRRAADLRLDRVWRRRRQARRARNPVTRHHRGHGYTRPG